MLPFGLGYGVCYLMGLNNLSSLVAGATLTATSVGVTGRVLMDLGRLQELEGQIILGAAVIDDLIGLVLLAVVSGLSEGIGLTALGVLQNIGVGFGFVAGALILGGLIVPRVARAAKQVDLPGAPTILALIFALALAWLAAVCGSALIIDAFVAGLLMRETPQLHEIEGVAHLGRLFVPIFFITVGAAVDVSAFNFLEPDNRPILVIGGLLIVAAIVGKLAAGYAPFWIDVNKKVIGVGMVPRGEVGLIFGQMRILAGAFDAKLFSAVTLMVTTFIATPLLRHLFPPRNERRRRPMSLASKA